MTEDSLAITYETLYEILRSEKNKEELCELDKSFYRNVLEYLREKTRILQEAAAKNDIFSMDERDNTQVQLQNIRKIIKEIYERREKKIIDMALNKSRTNSDIIDTANLLETENKFFEKLREVLDRFRTGILAQTIALKEPDFEIEYSMQMPEEELPEPAEEPEFSPKENTEPKTEEKPIEQKNTKKIKITKHVEQFVGAELELYGPYTADDTAEVPAEIAEILIGKGSAIETE